ncbi:MAG: hypothetical protein JWL59_4277 [Chthoniobacteraceae bacterium]|nr:hypothetical protein [Chthoniobacteraceae bacterium]
MNLRLLFCIGMGFFTTYMGLAMLITHFRAQPKSVIPSKPNFSARAEQSVDAETGEKLVYREFTVSTKLASEVTPKPPEAR